MADIVNTGAMANDGSGDDLRTAFQLINERFQQLLGTLSQITWAPGLAISATPLRQWTVVAGQAYVATSNHIAGAAFAADLADGKWLSVDVAQLLADLATTGTGKGAQLVAFRKSGVASAVETTVDELMQQAPLVPAMFGGDLQVMFTAAMANSLAVYIPGGDYTLTAKIVASGARAISVTGDGPANTRLFWTSSDSGIELLAANGTRSGAWTVRGIGLYANNTAAPCVGPALKIGSVIPQGGIPYAGGLIDDVVIDTNPDTNKSPRQWTNGLHIKNVGGLDFGSVFLYGSSSGWNGNGIVIEGDCTPGPNMVDVKVYKFDKAITNPGTSADTTEGIVLGPGCVLVNNNYGVDLDFTTSVTGGNPAFQVNGAHFNNNIRNVRTKYANQVSIRGALMYKRTTSTADFVHIDIENANNLHITDNKLTNIGAGGTNKCITLGGTTINARVVNNTLQSATGYSVGLEIGASCRNINYSLNDFANATVPVVNNIPDELDYSGASDFAIDGSILLLSLDGDGQSIPNATDTVVTDWLVRTESQAATHSAGAITIGKNVRRVRFSLQMLFANNSTGRRELSLTKNGTSFFGQPFASGNPVSGAATGLHCQSGEVDVVAGDVFRVVVYQNSGGALNVSSTVSSWVSMQVIA